MTRKRINYPNKENPDCSGTVFYDNEADPDVTYLHYVDFKRPGKKAVTECVAVENATGKKYIVQEPPPDFSKFVPQPDGVPVGLNSLSVQGKSKDSDN